MKSSSSSSPLSSSLCLRLAVVVVVAGGGCSEEAPARPWGCCWARNTGDGEAGEFGVDGRSEAFGEGMFGAVSSARANAGEGNSQ